MRLPLTQQATSLHDSLTADLRTITSTVSGGFTTPGGLEQAIAAISRMQDSLPALRRELRAIRAQIRSVA